MQTQRVKTLSQSAHNVYLSKQDPVSTVKNATKINKALIRNHIWTRKNYE